MKRDNRGRRRYWLALCAAGIASPLAASPQCGAHDAVVAALAEGYSEARQSYGLDASGYLVETFASEAGSWTIIVTPPGGQTCLVATGEAFQLAAEALPPSGEDM